jgi:hypothetical protein
VLVHACGYASEHDIAPARAGIVTRLRRADAAAWVALDERGEDAWHPFPADDEHGRGTHVLAWPDDCDEVRS